MPRVYSQALEQHIEIDRVIGDIRGQESGPTVVFLAGIHGNEPSGVFALHRVMKKLKRTGIKTGRVLAIAGHLWALEKGVRYEKNDLNRLWTVENLRTLARLDEDELDEDQRQQKELYSLVKQVLTNHSTPLYFFDLHTTSSETQPFLTVNDSLLNRRFVEQYPAPIVLGIEEYLDGAILSYINELGYVAFGYEGGQHDDLCSIENHEAFAYLSLHFCGVLPKEIPVNHFREVLERQFINAHKFYEIRHRQSVELNDDFVSIEGLVNFQKVRRSKTLATLNGKPIKAPLSGRIFMPLYQSQGQDGFYIVRRIPKTFLRWSAHMRDWKLDRWLTWLPGIKRNPDQPNELLVNRQIARFFSKQFFHLLGYRNKVVNAKVMRVKNREHPDRRVEYAGSKWLM